MRPEKQVQLQVPDPHAVKPVKRQHAWKRWLQRLENGAVPELTGEENPPPEIIGAGNWFWKPLAWTRWLWRWEQFKTFLLVACLVMVWIGYALLQQRKQVHVQVKTPAEELLLKNNFLPEFDRQNLEAFLVFALTSANQVSAEGMTLLPLLEGSVDPIILTSLKQRQQQNRSLQFVENTPIQLLYITRCTRWRYNPARRIAEVYVMGFRFSGALNNVWQTEPYRAQVVIMLEPMSNRNRWGYYIRKLNEYYGKAAETMDAVILKEGF